jgi:hypothetical protein
VRRLALSVGNVTTSASIAQTLPDSARARVFPIRHQSSVYGFSNKLAARARALEIGSHVGSSALFICAGMAGRGGHLYCVDTWANDTMPDGPKGHLCRISIEQACRCVDEHSGPQVTLASLERRIGSIPGCEFWST